VATGRLPDPNTAPVTAKGDLYTYSTVPAKLAVGNDGETLVADSSATTGLRYQPAKTTNHIINGGFDFWQRATSNTFTPVSGSPQYNSVDRFWFAASGTTGSMTASRQTADTVSLQYGLRFGRASGATATAVAYVGTNIESQQMKLLAGKAVVLSFYAKSGANFSYTPTVRLYSGTGTDQAPVNLFNGAWTGAADVVNTTFSPTSTMTRYTFTGTVPTTSNELAFWINWTPSGTAGANEWLQIEGVQLEVGSVATEFQRSGGTLAGELAACLRYYELSYKTGDAPGTNVTGGTTEIHANGCAIVQVPVTGTAGSSRGRAVPVPFKVVKRTTPTTRFWDLAGNISKYTAADVNGSFISNNNSVDTFGGINANSHMLAFQTSAASSAHIYCGIMWEASAEL
jgi:hypothetical protein